MKRYEHFKHDADVGIRGIGDTLEEAFEMAACALAAVAIDPEKIEPKTEVDISCESPGAELLLYDFLNSVIFEMDTRAMAFGRFAFEDFSPVRLKARLFGEHVDRAKHAPGVEVKGATMTELKAERTDHQWVAQCVVDV